MTKGRTMISRRFLVPAGRLLGLSVALFLAPFFGQALLAQAPQKGSPPPFVIVGTIRNFDELSPLVVPESFVQLVPLSEDGSYAIENDAAGRQRYVSSLPTAAMPEKAAFQLEMAGVPPGKYQLAAQRLKPQELPAGRRPWFAKDAKTVLVVEVPEKGEPFEVKVGKVVVWTK